MNLMRTALFAAVLGTSMSTFAAADTSTREGRMDEALQTYRDKTGATTTQAAPMEKKHHRWMRHHRKGGKAMSSNNSNNMPADKTKEVSKAP